MAQFRKAVITQIGLALIQKTQIQSAKLEFTKIVIGAGGYTENEEVGNSVGLKEPMQEFPISAIEVQDVKTVKLTAVLSNIELQNPYYMREIGIFANDPDEGEVLYSLAVAYPGKADYLPAYDGVAPVTIGLETYQTVSNSGNVTIRVDTGAYASAKDLEDLKDAVNALPSTICVDITIPQMGWEKDNAIEGYHTDIEIDVMTASVVPMMSVWPESMEEAQDSGILPTVMSMDGALRVYARRIPESDLQCSLTMFGVAAGVTNGGTSVGDGNYVLPAATRARLGGVRIGSGINVTPDGTISVDEDKILTDGAVADDADATEMLNDVFK